METGQACHAELVWRYQKDLGPDSVNRQEDWAL